MGWPNDDDGRVDDRERRVIRNETLFREVNERIEDVSREVPESELLEFLCECGEASCGEHIELTRDEYERVRRASVWFAIKPGHEHPDFERVVERHERFSVIEKVGRSAQVAESTDPRD